MNDDWRLQVDLARGGPRPALTERLAAQQLEHDLSAAFHDRVIVTRDGGAVFLYAGTREQAEQARRRHRSGRAPAQIGRSMSSSATGIPTAEEWEDPDKPLPSDDAAKLAEREELMARELEETAWSGSSRIRGPSRSPLAPRCGAVLRATASEGLPTVHRWRYLLVGATNEDMRQGTRRADSSRGSRGESGQRRGHLGRRLRRAPTKPLRRAGRARRLMCTTDGSAGSRFRSVAAAAAAEWFFEVGCGEARGVARPAGVAVEGDGEDLAGGEREGGDQQDRPDGDRDQRGAGGRVPVPYAEADPEEDRLPGSWRRSSRRRCWPGR